MLRHYVQTWHLAAPHHLASTTTSHVYTVQHHGDTVLLKVLTPVGQEEEQGAAAALTWFAGAGAMRLWHSDAHTLLLEDVAGDTLSGLVATGHDDAATDIIADVMVQLSRPVESAGLPGLTPLPQRFRALFGRAQQAHAAPGASLCVDAAAVAHALLADQQEPCVLHRDLHHEHMTYAPQRGWLALDPKGRMGERASDAAHVVCNPVTLPGLVQSEARWVRQAHRLAARLRLSPQRFLAWVYAHACLAASWSLEDGTEPQHGLRMAHAVRPHVSQDLHKRGRW
jgi:streptomycin 6-kinase